MFFESLSDLSNNGEEDKRRTIKRSLVVRMKMIKKTHGIIKIIRPQKKVIKWFNYSRLMNINQKYTKNKGFKF